MQDGIAGDETSDCIVGAINEWVSSVRFVPVACFMSCILYLIVHRSSYLVPSLFSSFFTKLFSTVYLSGDKYPFPLFFCLKSCIIRGEKISLCPHSLEPQPKQ